jgi:hypothetical protein
MWRQYLLFYFSKIHLVEESVHLFLISKRRRWKWVLLMFRPVVSLKLGKYFRLKWDHLFCQPFVWPQNPQPVGLVHLTRYSFR